MDDRRTQTFFAWYDCWVGAYYDRKGRWLYVCLIPMVVIAIPIGARIGNWLAPKEA